MQPAPYKSELRCCPAAHFELHYSAENVGVQVQPRRARHAYGCEGVLFKRLSLNDGVARFIVKLTIALASSFQANSRRQMHYDRMVDDRS